MKDGFTEVILNNLRKIMNDKNLTQSVMASYAKTTPSQFSKIMSGSVQLSLSQLSNIATSLAMREIDLITYPEVYVSRDNLSEKDSVEAVLQIKLRKERKEEVLKLLFGNTDIDLLY